MSQVYSQQSSSLQWGLLIGVCLLSFTGFLDATIVSTALPSMQTHLGMSLSQLQWVMNAFFLGISAFMASMGRVADLYGRRKVFFIGTWVFAAASVIAGLAPNSLILIACRLLQGASVAITIPVGIAIIQSAHDKQHIAKAMSIFGAVTGAGLALGPVIGGVLVTAFSWPAIFFINIPFVVVGFVLCLSYVKESRSQTKMTLDYFGVVFLTLSIGALVYGMVEANTMGWGSRAVLSSFVIALLSLMLFVFTEHRVKHPIMAGYLFKNRVFIAASLFSFAAGGAMSVVLFIDPLYLHYILQQSNFATGLTLFFIPLCVIITAYMVGHVHSSLGSRNLMLLGALAYIAMSLLHMTLGIALSYVLILPTFLLMGVAWGIANTTPSTALGEHIASDHISVAMGALYSFYNIGAAVVLALSVILFHLQTAASIIKNLAQQHITLTAADRLLLHQFAHQPDQLQYVAQHLSMAKNTAERLLRQAFISGMDSMFMLIAGLALLALLVILFVMKSKPSSVR